ncbi:hypothetical protein ILUMI_24196 [Ignelater luminosus]|uniref:HTH psq-type domain-containing protein n=1 Tax=Ignelater luminosus TaxID=2038154 RepID=A0A8K0CAZ2_IGNLU|nr:hypothetical protein ILUMI_24196 [Ignelater luminosus]
MSTGSKRKDLTLKQKLTVIEYAEESKANQNEVARKFGISQAQFADDQNIMVNNKGDMEYTVRKLIEKLHKWEEKTKYLCIGTEPENLVIDKKKEIGVIDEYKYLGTTFNRKGTDDQEINFRIIKALRDILCLNAILYSKDIIKRRKYNI